jgi:hypothetical protein
MNSFLRRSLSEPERDSGSTIEEEGSSILSSSESIEADAEFERSEDFSQISKLGHDSALPLLSED